MTKESEDLLEVNFALQLVNLYIDLGI